MAATGTSVVPMLAAAFGAVVTGAALVLVSRARLAVDRAPAGRHAKRSG